MADNRLKKTEEIKKIFQLGKRIKTEIFDFIFVGNELDRSRFSVIVSTKVSKRATVRNRIKRQIREIMRALLAQINKNNDILIIIKGAIVGRTAEQIKKALIYVFNKSSIFS